MNHEATTRDQRKERAAERYHPSVSGGAIRGGHGTRWLTSPPASSWCHISTWPMQLHFQFSLLPGPLRPTLGRPTHRPIPLRRPVGPAGHFGAVHPPLRRATPTSLRAATGHVRGRANIGGRPAPYSARGRRFAGGRRAAHRYGGLGHLGGSGGLGVTRCASAIRASVQHHIALDRCPRRGCHRGLASAGGERRVCRPWPGQAVAGLVNILGGSPVAVVWACSTA
jgi:hypothetical protein